MNKSWASPSLSVANVRFCHLWQPDSSFQEDNTSSPAVFHFLLFPPAILFQCCDEWPIYATLCQYYKLQKYPRAAPVFWRHHLKLVLFRLTRRNLLRPESLWHQILFMFSEFKENVLKPHQRAKINPGFNGVLSVQSFLCMKTSVFVFTAWKNIPLPSQL